MLSLTVWSAGHGSVNVCYVHLSSVSEARDTITDYNDVVRQENDEGQVFGFQIAGFEGQEDCSLFAALTSLFRKKKATQQFL